MLLQIVTSLCLDSIFTTLFAKGIHDIFDLFHFLSFSDYSVQGSNQASIIDFIEHLIWVNGPMLVMEIMNQLPSEIQVTLNKKGGLNQFFIENLNTFIIDQSGRTSLRISTFVKLFLKENGASSLTAVGQELTDAIKDKRLLKEDIPKLKTFLENHSDLFEVTRISQADLSVRLKPTSSMANGEQDTISIPPAQRLPSSPNGIRAKNKPVQKQQDGVPLICSHNKEDVSYSDSLPNSMDHKTSFKKEENNDICISYLKDLLVENDGEILLPVFDHDSERSQDQKTIPVTDDLAAILENHKEFEINSHGTLRLIEQHLFQCIGTVSLVSEKSGFLQTSEGLVYFHRNVCNVEDNSDLRLIFHKGDELICNAKIAPPNFRSDWTAVSVRALDEDEGSDCNSFSAESQTSVENEQVPLSSEAVESLSDIDEDVYTIPGLCSTKEEAFSTGAENSLCISSEYSLIQSEAEQTLSAVLYQCRGTVSQIFSNGGFLQTHFGLVHFHRNVCNIEGNSDLRLIFHTGDELICNAKKAPTDVRSDWTAVSVRALDEDEGSDCNSSSSESQTSVESEQVPLSSEAGESLSDIDEDVYRIPGLCSTKEEALSTDTENSLCDSSEYPMIQPEGSTDFQFNFHTGNELICNAKKAPPDVRTKWTSVSVLALGEDEESDCNSSSSESQTLVKSGKMLLSLEAGESLSDIDEDLCRIPGYCSIKEKALCTDAENSSSDSSEYPLIQPEESTDFQFNFHTDDKLICSTKKVLPDVCTKWTLVSLQTLDEDVENDCNLSSSESQTLFKSGKMLLLLEAGESLSDIDEDISMSCCCSTKYESIGTKTVCVSQEHQKSQSIDPEEKSDMSYSLDNEHSRHIEDLTVNDDDSVEPDNPQALPTYFEGNIGHAFKSVVKDNSSLQDVEGSDSKTGAVSTQPSSEIGTEITGTDVSLVGEKLSYHNAVEMERNLNSFIAGKSLSNPSEKCDVTITVQPTRAAFGVDEPEGTYTEDNSSKDSLEGLVYSQISTGNKRKRRQKRSKHKDTSTGNLDEELQINGFGNVAGIEEILQECNGKVSSVAENLCTLVSIRGDVSSESSNTLCNSESELFSSDSSDTLCDYESKTSSGGMDNHNGFYQKDGTHNEDNESLNAVAASKRNDFAECPDGAQIMGDQTNSSEVEPTDEGISNDKVLKASKKLYHDREVIGERHEVTEITSLSPTSSKLGLPDSTQMELDGGKSLQHTSILLSPSSEAFTLNQGLPKDKEDERGAYNACMFPKPGMLQKHFVIMISQILLLLY